MRQYKLVYLQAYEVDDDSPSGIGDHSIQHERTSQAFEARTDEDAMLEVSKFLKSGSVMFDHHIDGDGKEHMRRPVELTTTRIVRRWE